MQPCIPGTTVPRAPGQSPDALLEPMFLAGGLMLSQVSSLTGLEPHAIQNWVKRGFVSAPLGKRYTKRQFARIVLINMLKDTMQLDRITRLLSYLNGHLDDESDDLIDDFELYCAVVRLTSRLDSDALPAPAELSAWCDEALGNYVPVRSGARERVARGLQIILVAHEAALLKARAEEMLSTLEPRA